MINQSNLNSIIIESNINPGNYKDLSAANIDKNNRGIINNPKCVKIPFRCCSN